MPALSAEMPERLRTFVDSGRNSASSVVADLAAGLRTDLETLVQNDERDAALALKLLHKCRQERPPIPEAKAQIGKRAVRDEELGEHRRVLHFEQVTSGGGANGLARLSMCGRTLLSRMVLVHLGQPKSGGSSPLERSDHPA
jgi:hypothetical protein